MRPALDEGGIADLWTTMSAARSSSFRATCTKLADASSSPEGGFVPLAWGLTPVRCHGHHNSWMHPTKHERPRAKRPSSPHEFQDPSGDAGRCPIGLRPGKALIEAHIQNRC